MSVQYNERMPKVVVRNLKKYYSIAQKEPGLTGSIKSLFSRKYTEVKAVDDISFNIEEGELVGFLGPNGAGKTTTLKVLSGLLYPTSGEVRVLGYEPFKREREFQKQFALVMGQKNQTWWDLPAIESFTLNKEIYEVPDKQFKETLLELSELLEVKDLLNTQIRKLSLGQRMKMELIASLIHSPKVMFLDEPTIGLDVLMQKKIREFIREYNSRHHATIILTSHYMDDVKELCKRVVIIDQGKILFDGPLDKIIKRFSDHKDISLTLGKEVEEREFGKFGVKSYRYPQVVLSVKRSDVASVAEKLLRDFPVDDLNIEEPSLEDIIRQVFSKKRI